MLDLGLVRGIDSSAVKSFEKIMQLLNKNDIYLFLANLAAEFHRLIIIMIGNQLMKASRAMVEATH